MDDIIVIDCGTDTFRAGAASDFPCDNEPRVLLPSQIIVHPEGSQNQPGNGEQAPADRQYRQIYDVNGAIESWEGYESVLYHILYEQLGWPPGDEGYLIATQPPAATRSDSERVTQLMFETFNVLGYYVVDAPVASLYAMGKTQGAVVDVGHSATDFCQVLDGAMLPGTSQRLPIGGARLDRQLRHMMSQRGVELSPGDVHTLKERVTSVAERAELFAATCADCAAETHTLPDGQTVSITSEGYELGEALFAPERLSSHLKQPNVRPCGIAEGAFANIMQQNEPLLRKLLFESVLVCGGCTGAPNLLQRFVTELKALVPPSITPSLILAPEYMPDKVTQYSSYVGASILGKVINPFTHFVSKTDYEEFGPAVVHKKCCCQC